MNGVYNRGVAITVANSGLIETTGTADGIYLRGGGGITNNAGATIAGSAAGIAIGPLGGMVSNRGIVKGVIGFNGGIHRSGNTTLINFGTVASTSTLAGAVAVDMGNSVGSKVLIVEKGAVFTGLVEGGRPRRDRVCRHRHRGDGQQYFRLQHRGIGQWRRRQSDPRERQFQRC